ncbi:unnamed protein product, partial [Meganyctiphanes norvegica]
MGGSIGKGSSGSFELESHSRHNSIVSAIAGNEVDPPGYTAKLETADEKKYRKRSHLVAYATMFFMSIGQSIVVSGVWPYLNGLDPEKDKGILGFVIAALPLGQLIAAPLLGIWFNKIGSIRLPCLVTVICFIIGNILYSILDLFGDSAFWFMIIARFIIGLSTGNVTLCRLYVAAATTTKERTITISIVAASQALGFVVGPGIQSALVPLGSSVPRGGEIVFDMYTAAGWVSALMGVLNLIILLPFFFKEYYIAEKEQAMVSQGKEEVKLPAPNMKGLGSILCGYFCSIFVYVLIESMATPLVMDLYGLAETEAVTSVGVALMAGGGVSVVMFLTAAFLTKKFDERLVMYVVGFVPLIIGCVLFIPFSGPAIPTYSESDNVVNNITEVMSTVSTLASEGMSTVSTLASEGMSTVSTLSTEATVSTVGPVINLGCPVDTQPWCEDIPATHLEQLLVGFVICIAGYAAAQALTQAIFSKILGPKPQGIWFGVLTGMGSLSRIIGPIFVSAIYTNLGTIVTFSTLTGIMVFSLIVLLIFHKHMEPMDTGSPNNNNN